MEELKLSIIIVGLNVKEWMVPCLRSIFENSPSFKFEVIYVDNRSKDQTLGAIKNIKNIKIIKNIKNLGFTKANNQGAKIAKGKYLLFLNSDTEIVGEALGKMVSYLEKHPEIGILGPKIYQSKKRDLQVTSTGRLTPLNAIFALTFLNKLFPNNRFSKSYFMSDWNRNSTREVEAVSGAALLIRKDVFEKIGGFDERFFIYFEENDLCLSAKKLGKKVVYCPEARIIHYGGKTTTKISQEMKKVFFKSRYRYFKKHYGLISGLITEGILRVFEAGARIL